MCTVTILPKGENDFILTSNRDEAPGRIPIEPDFYYINDTKMLFPKDKEGGGTWIGTSEKNRLICLLNGGFVCHVKTPPYRISRGIVVKDLLSADDIVTAIETYDLDNVEPFTLVISDWNSGLRFFELIWDGNQKHFTELPLEPKIWSSSTLYSESMKSERTSWFQDFIDTSDELNSNSILDFHKTAGNEHKDYGVIMDRGKVRTTSITQVKKNNTTIEMTYHNLQNNIKASQVLKNMITVNE